MTRMRLDKLLSNMGYGSRNNIKKDVKSGIVTVDGKVAKSPSIHIDSEKNEVKYNGHVVVYKEFIYIMMNKAQGLVSATYDNYDETVIDILDDEYKIFEPFPVGRLDKDTEGLLIISNDGAFSHRVLSPKNYVAKKYLAKLARPIDEETIKKFEAGIELEDFKTQASKLEAINDEKTEVLVTITEGKFHQVKRMFKACNNEVLYLKRVKMGGLDLDESLDLGEYRELTEEEIKLIEKGE